MEKLKEILKNYLNNGSDRIDVTMVLSLIEHCEKDTIRAIEVIHCCKSDSEQLCECDAPLIRTSDKGGEYCGYCEKDLD